MNFILHRSSLGDGEIDRSAPMAPQLYALLRKAIIQNRYPPGAPIYEGKLGDILGVSRTPLRAALQQLAKEGLVETRPQVGSIVAPVDQKKVFSAVFCRSALETAVARRLAETRPAELSRLSRVLALQAECTSRDDYITFFDVDEEFHRLLAEIAGVPDAWRLVMSSKSHVDRARLHLQSTIPGRAAGAYEEHLLILDAIRAGDVERSSELMNKHVSSALDVIGQAD